MHTTFPPLTQSACARRPTTSRGLYVEGCYTKTRDWLEENRAIIGGISIGILVVMLVNLGFALYLWCAISRDRPSRGDYGKARGRDY